MRGERALSRRWEPGSSDGRGCARIGWQGRGLLASAATAAAAIGTRAGVAAKGRFTYVQRAAQDRAGTARQSTFGCPPVPKGNRRGGSDAGGH